MLLTNEIKAILNPINLFVIVVLTALCGLMREQVWFSFIISTFLLIRIGCVMMWDTECKYILPYKYFTVRVVLPLTVSTLGYFFLLV